MENNVKKNGLGFKELLALGVGQVIGAGVVTLVGQAIGTTGRSAWLAFPFAVVLGLCIILPYIFLSSMIRVNGGNYTFVATVLGERWGGMYGLAFTLNSLACGMFGLSMATYLAALFPGLNVKATAVVVITLFYITNIMGVSFLARIQKVMSTCLIVGLSVFVAVGLSHVRPGSLDFSSPEFFTAGTNGFLSAAMLLVFSCTGQSFIVAYSKEANNPRRDVPYAILGTTGVILVVYSLIALVAGGVLPVNQVAGKPLTVVAEQILSKPLYLAFIIGGPIMALATTLNSAFTVFTRPFHQMAKDGWVSTKLAVTNQQGSPYILMTIAYLIAIVPVLFGLSISAITSNCILISRISDIVAIAAVILLPRRLPEAWDNRYFKVSKPVYYALMCFSLCITVFVIILSLKNLTPSLITFTVVVLLLFYIYSTLRMKSGKVQMEKSYELQ